MPSAERYKREKERARAEGTTPYRRRVRSAIQRNPGITRSTAAGHAPSRDEALAHRRRARQIREALRVAPTGWCVVCGSKVEASRPNSYADRTCGNEQVRRFRANDGAEEWASFRGLAKLSKDRSWVAQRRAHSRAHGVPLRRPSGVRIAS